MATKLKSELKINQASILRRIFDANVDGEKWTITIAVDEDGRVLDKNTDFIALPCPPYCGGRGGNSFSMTCPSCGQRRKVMKIGDYFTQEDAHFLIPEHPDTSGYDSSDIAKVEKQVEGGGLIEVKVKVIEKNDCPGDESTALFKIDSNARIMDEDNHLVAMKTIVKVV